MWNALKTVFVLNVLMPVWLIKHNPYYFLLIDLSIQLQKTYKMVWKRMKSVLLNSIEPIEFSWRGLVVILRCEFFQTVFFAFIWKWKKKENKENRLEWDHLFCTFFSVYAKRKRIHENCERNSRVQTVPSFNKVRCSIQWTHKFEVIGILFIKFTGVKANEQLRIA